MKKSPMKRTATLFGGLLLAVGVGIAQDPEPKVWLPPEALPGGQEDPRKQLEEAFQRVETNLQGMNVLLLDASKGDTSRITGAGGSDFDALLQKASGRPQGAATDALAELLYASEGQGQSVIDGIDEILRIADENSKGGGGGGL